MMHTSGAQQQMSPIPASPPVSRMSSLIVSALYETLNPNDGQSVCAETIAVCGAASDEAPLARGAPPGLWSLASQPGCEQGRADRVTGSQRAAKWGVATRRTASGCRRKRRILRACCGCRCNEQEDGASAQRTRVTDGLGHGLSPCEP